MRSQHNPIIIVSVDSIRNTKGQNSLNRIAFQTALEKFGISYQECEGVFEGNIEKSYLLQHNNRSMELALSTLDLYDQDCFLTMDNEGRGTLINHDGTKEKLGFLETSYNKPSGDYTRVVGTDQYLTFSGRY